MRVAAVFLAACSGGGDDGTTSPTTTPPTSTADTGPVGEGTLAITFAIDPDYVPYMDEEPVGPFWGDVYLSDDVSSIGPDPGATALAAIAVALVDLPRDGTATAVLATTVPLPAVEVAILGFQDSDDNADPGAPDPDDADPVTLPHQNRFQVVADAETTVQVYFGLLNP